MAPIPLQLVPDAENCQVQGASDRILLGDKNQHFHPLYFLLPGSIERAGYPLSS